MPIKILLRRGGEEDFAANETLATAEPLWDIQRSRLGIGRDTAHPLWYPRIDPNNGDLLLNPNTNLRFVTLPNVMIAPQGDGLSIMVDGLHTLFIGANGQITVNGAVTFNGDARFSGNTRFDIQPILP